jgi:hypothetical protein
MTGSTFLSVMHLIASAILLMAGATSHAQTAGQKLAIAADVFNDGILQQETHYRQTLGEIIGSSATRCEVYLLDCLLPIGKDARISSDPSDENHFPIRPYEKETKILKRRELGAEEFKALLPSLVQIVAVEGNTYGAMCHQPIHGLRIYDQGVLIFETSICYECRNFFVLYPNGGAGWVGLNGNEFEDQMKKLMPIPESEIQRFNDYKSGKWMKEQIEKLWSEKEHKAVKKTAK